MFKRLLFDRSPAYPGRMRKSIVLGMMLGAFALVALPGCEEKKPATPCESAEDCKDDQKCEEKVCVRLTTAEKAQKLKKKKQEEADKKMNDAMGQ